MVDAQDFATGFAFQCGVVVQCISDGDQLIALVVTVPGALARAVLEALDLRQVVPPQVFGFVGRIDDGVWQAIFAVEVFGLLTQRVDLGNQIAFRIVAGRPDGAVRVSDLFDQRGLVVMLITGGSAQRVGFCGQA